MKKVVLLATIAFFFSQSSKAQRNYITSQGETIFSWSNYTGDSDIGNTRTRFSIFPNVEYAYNLDGAGALGMYFGISHRNIGFNWKDSTRHKRRAMSLGVPLVFKIGDLENDNFFFFGGEAEILYHYKKKDWDPDGNKTKSSEWLSSEVNMLQTSAMLGYCTNRVMFKFKYYFNDFFNTEYVNSIGAMPYANTQSNIFYFSLAVRTDMDGNDDEDEEYEEEGDGEGFDFGYNLLLHDMYRDI